MTEARPKTRSGTPRQSKTSARKLSEIARHLVIPTGIVSNGYPAVRDKLRDMGIEHDEWQAGAARLMLGKRADGTYAATVDGVVMSIPRQVGKTFLIGSVIIALCLLIPGLTVLWTAHRTRTATETFKAFKAMTGRPKVKPHMLDPRNTNGEQEITFRNGSRILFGAREAGFGRGFTEVDVEVFDEAQILTDKALDDMLAAMNQPKNPAGALHMYIGTPPRPTDPSDAFKRMRDDALTGETTDAVYVEFSAEKGTSPGDLDRIAEYNPSYPLRTPLASLLRLRKKLSAASYRREAMGIWDEDDSGGGALSIEAWKLLADQDAERGTGVVFGVDVTEERSAWIAVTWAREDGRRQVQLADAEARPAFGLVDRCVELAARWHGAFAVPKALAKEFTDAGLQVIEISTADFTSASGSFADDLTAGVLRHGNQEALNGAVKAAKWRKAGTGGEQAFQLAGCPEVGPLAAAARALQGTRQDVESVYESRGLVEL